MSKRSDAMKRACPECGAHPFAPCVSSDGQSRRSVHRDRFGGIIPVRNVRDVAGEIIESAKRVAADRIQGQYEYGSERCESPIEKIFLAQLLHPDIGSAFEAEVEIMCPPSGLVENTQPPPYRKVFVYPQITIGDYRVDFLLRETLLADRALIVECDGHDFHEKTKEQAQRDKARDRYLVGRGFTVLRFTGSEIYRNPFDCAEEAITILMGYSV